MNTEYDEQLRSVEASILRVEAFLNTYPERRQEVMSLLNAFGLSLAQCAMAASLRMPNSVLIVVNDLQRREIEFDKIRATVRQLTATAEDLGRGFEEFGRIRAEDLKMAFEPVAKVIKDKPKWKNGRNGALNRIICKPQYT